MLGLVDWQRVAGDLDRDGFAILPGLIPLDICIDLISLYDQPDRFRSRVVMARHGFGQGEYQYFRYPLPEIATVLREGLYVGLRPTAEHWRRLIDAERPVFPATHTEFLARCHGAGQTRPTPLLLRYGPGDFNCLHQDMYGEHVFPLQMAVMLSRPGVEFTGGEFVLTEQRPRQQSRAHVVPLGLGDAVIFAVHHRPVTGSRGPYRATLRHGVSRILSGQRHVLGIILHDAA